MINYIKIEGYKSIKRLEIEFESINVLIGANGVGKSNFISFFKLIHEIYEKRLENYSLKKGAETLLHFGSRFTSEIKAHLEFDKKNGYKVFGLEYGFKSELLEINSVEQVALVSDLILIPSL